MSERQLEPAAKAAIRTYIYRGFAVSASLVVIFISIAAFLVQDVILERANYTALREATAQLFETQKEISDVRAKVQQDAEEMAQLREDTEHRAAEFEKTAEEVRQEVGEIKHMQQQIVETKANVDNLWSEIRNNEDFAQLTDERQGLLKQVAAMVGNHPAFRAKVLETITQPNIYVLGHFKCSANRHIVPVPVKGTTTDQWLVFGINPHVSSLAKTKNGDNAVFSFKTDVRPARNRRSWSIQYLVEINHASDQYKKLRLTKCPSAVRNLQVVAMRAYPTIQAFRR